MEPGARRRPAVVVRHRCSCPVQGHTRPPARRGRPPADDLLVRVFRRWLLGAVGLSCPGAVRRREPEPRSRLPGVPALVDLSRPGRVRAGMAAVVRRCRHPHTGGRFGSGRRPGSPAGRTQTVASSVRSTGFGCARSGFDTLHRAGCRVGERADARGRSVRRGIRYRSGRTTDGGAGLGASHRTVHQYRSAQGRGRRIRYSRRHRRPGAGSASGSDGARLARSRRDSEGDRCRCAVRHPAGAAQRSGSCSRHRCRAGAAGATHLDRRRVGIPGVDCRRPG